LDAKGGRGAGKMANNRSEMKFKLRGNLIFDSSQQFRYLLLFKLIFAPY